MANSSHSSADFFVNEIAFLPLQWFATDDGWLDFGGGPPIDALLEEVLTAGFKAITLQPPPNGDWKRYAASLELAGVAPGPGLLGVPLDCADALTANCEAARELARVHSDLGLTEVFVIDFDEARGHHAPRFIAPAQGVGRSVARLRQIAESLSAIGEAMAEFNVTACLHQHVGTWIEVEDELEWILAHVDPEILALGPDVGHLAWAGIDPVAFISRHLDRVRSVHFNDVRLDVAERSRLPGGLTYPEATLEGLWVEPGRGDLDLTGVVSALGETFRGWITVDVDRADLPSLQLSAKACADWAREALTPSHVGHEA